MDVGFCSRCHDVCGFEELIPEAHLGEHSNIGTLGVMGGFMIMMILDVALG